MENFQYSLKTNVIFGKECIQSLETTLKAFGKNVLMLYWQLVRGGVMDASKAIAAGALYAGDVWDFFTEKSIIEKALPLVGIVTVAASGSKLGNGAVISNPVTNAKLSADNDCIRFHTIFMDPTYTFTVPKKHTAAGSIDILSHLMEQYFTGSTNMLSMELVEGVMRTVIHYSPIAYADPTNEEARAQLMWASSLANNFILSLGCSYSGWSCYAIEHELSAYHNLTHGTGLAIVTGNWMKYVLNEKTVKSFAGFGRNVWSIREEDDMLCAKKAIDALIDFYRTLGSPVTLTELNVGSENFHAMAKEAVKNGYLEYAWVPLNEEDVINILEMCL